MDPTSAVLCTIGAAALALLVPSSAYHATRLLGIVALSAGVIGVSRATGKKAHALIVVFVLSFAIDGLWDTLPEAFVDWDFYNAHKSLVLATQVISDVVFTVGLVGTLIVARERLGRGPMTLGIVLLGLGLILMLLGLASNEGSDGGLLLKGLEAGVRSTALRTTAVCLLLVGLGPESAPPIPHRFGGSFAVVAAIVLSCVLSSPQAERSLGESLFFVFEGVWLFAAIGVGNLARAGFGSSARAAIALCVVQMIAFVGAMFIFDKLAREYIASALEMSMAAGFLGFVATLTGGKELALRGPRRVAAALVGMAAFGAIVSFVATMISLLRIVRIHDSFKPVEVIIRPTASIGFVLTACCIAWMLGPPAAPVRA